jgi:hypothetical protein
MNAIIYMLKMCICIIFPHIPTLLTGHNSPAISTPAPHWSDPNFHLSPETGGYSKVLHGFPKTFQADGGMVTLTFMGRALHYSSSTCAARLAQRRILSVLVSSPPS